MLALDELEGLNVTVRCTYDDMMTVETPLVLQPLDVQTVVLVMRTKPNLSSRLVARMFWVGYIPPTSK